MPAQLVKREERGGVPASRSGREFFEVGRSVLPPREIELLSSFQDLDKVQLRCTSD